jgi:5'-3' exonuclease
MLNSHLGDGYVKYCLYRLQKLLSLGIKLIVVLDGSRLNLKDAENLRREKERQLRKEQALNILKEG